MQVLKRAIKQSSEYIFFQGIGMSLSIMTFPIITRLFSIQDYGDLALANATLAILLCVIKMGIPSSFIRYYAETQFFEEKRNLYTNSLIGVLLTSAFLIAVYSIILVFLENIINLSMFEILLFIGLLALFKNIDNLCRSFFRARESVKTLGILNIINQIGCFGAGISSYVLFKSSLLGYFIGVTLFEIIFSFSLLIYFYDKDCFRIDNFSLIQIKKLYLYGFPLILLEISSLLNDYSDRYLIKYFLDSSQLAIYSVGYNLSSYMTALITSPLWMAIFPIYTKIWHDKGEKETVKFLTILLKYYWIIAILVICGFTAWRREIIEILASKKYSESHKIVPFIITSVMIYGSYHITNAGFFLKNKTKKIAIYTLIAALLNVFINIYFIPKYNIIGAAYSTLLSYSFLILIVSFEGYKLIRIRWPIHDIIINSIFAVFAVFIIKGIHFNNSFINILFPPVIYFIVYLLFIILRDKNIKRIIEANLSSKIK